MLITGGSQGAVALNEATAGWLAGGGSTGMYVLWATGRGSFGRFAVHQRAPDVQVFDFLDRIADAFAVATLVVGRAGMMTCAELCAWGLPSILVPLPTAAADHQTTNARALEASGAAEVLLQSALTPSTLGASISRLVRGTKCTVDENGKTRTFIVTSEPISTPSTSVGKVIVAQTVLDSETVKSTPIFHPFEGIVQVVDILVHEGDSVTQGQTVAFVEAMKAKHHIKSQINGIVSKVNVKIGDEINSATPLMILN